MNPRVFYDTHVVPNYDTWSADYTDRARAMNAASEANNMAEYMYHYLRSHRPAFLHGAKTATEYRNYLTEHECPDYQLVRDVADGHKHLRLDRKPRLITGAEQVRRDALRIDDLRGVTLREMNFTWKDTEDMFVVELDSGERRVLRIAVDRVLAMWRRLLGDFGL